MNLILPKYLACEMRFAELMAEMETNGIYLNKEKCLELIKKLEDEIAQIDKELVPAMPFKREKATILTNIYKKNGELNYHASNHIATGQPYSIEGNTMLRWKISPPNPGSDLQLRTFLLSLGWKPRDALDAWNYAKKKDRYGKMIIQKDEKGKWLRTTPKLPKEDWELDQLAKKSPVFKLIAERSKRKHRLGVMKGYIEKCRDDHRIPMIVNSCGTPTMRVTHKGACNVPKVGKFMGKELRSVFCAPEGRVLVGCDMSGQEACILAHLLGDAGFIKMIKDSGYKYHKYFYELSKEYISDINQQKSANFAFLYGCQDRKLGTLCDLKKDSNKEKIGAAYRKLLMKEVPGLEEATAKLLQQHRKYGAIKGLDGRWIKCRKESALINTYCQSGGAICSKIWTCKYRSAILSEALDSKHIIFMHDENAEETTPELGNRIGEIMLEGIHWTAKYLNLKIDLTGSYKVGKDWADVH